MNIQKFTQKSIESLNNSEKIASDYGNQEIDQEHFLFSLINVDESLIANLIEKMGIDKAVFASEVEKLIAARPKVSGSSSQRFYSSSLNTVLTTAEDEAKNMGDSYVSVEHLMLRLIAAPNEGLKKLFAEYNISRDTFLEVLKSVRGNQTVNTDNPEATYDALE